MLSERQRELVVLKVNEATDIPFMRESTEGRVIDKIVDFVNPRLEPSLRSLCPDPYVNCLKIALEDGPSSRDKRRRISAILHDVLAKPLGEDMAGKVDVALLSEGMEEKLLSLVCQKIVEEFVEWTVGEINEQFESRLDETREFALSHPGGAAPEGEEAAEEDAQEEEAEE